MRLFGAPASVAIPLLAAAGVALLFLLGTLAFRLWHYGYFGDSLLDDAFFFVRYGANFLDRGVFEWNPGEGPVHGNTSQFYQALVTLLYGMLGRNAVLALSVAATLGVLAYLVAMPLAYLRSRPQADRAVRFAAAVFVLALVCLDAQVVLLLGTGMETTWAMALVALSLIANLRLEQGREAGRYVALSAVCSLLVYATRPDAALLALAAPVGLALFARERRLRRLGLAAGALALALIGGFVLLCWLYYGDALPLAAVTKTRALTVLPEDGVATTGGFALSYLWIALSLHAPETILGLAAVLLFPRLPAALRGALIGMVVFTIYHLTAVVPIMGYFGRFLAPMLPILTLAAAQVAEAALAGSGLMRGWRALTVSGAASLAGLACLVLLKLGPTVPTVVLSHLPALQADAALNTREGSLAFAADEFPFFKGKMVRMVDAMRPDCSIASTEDGILSVYAHPLRVVDISGLHDPWIARHGFSTDRLFLEQRPDIIALPHPWYGDWLAAIEAHPALARDYVIDPAFTETGQPMAFRRDSACAARVRRAINER